MKFKQKTDVNSPDGTVTAGALGAWNETAVLFLKSDVDAHMC